LHLLQSLAIFNHLCSPPLREPLGEIQQIRDHARSLLVPLRRPGSAKAVRSRGPTRDSLSEVGFFLEKALFRHYATGIEERVEIESCQ
jgi:hypothetical protein